MDIKEFFITVKRINITNKLCGGSDPVIEGLLGSTTYSTYFLHHHFKAYYPEVVISPEELTIINGEIHQKRVKRLNSRYAKEGKRFLDLHQNQLDFIANRLYSAIGKPMLGFQKVDGVVWGEGCTRGHNYRGRFSHLMKIDQRFLGLTVEGTNIIITAPQSNKRKVYSCLLKNTKRSKVKKVS